MTKHQSSKTGKVLWEVWNERDAQDTRWGEQNHTPVEYFAVLAEEVGEVAKEVVDFHWCTWDAVKVIEAKRMRAELLQVAAVAVAMVECLDRNGTCDDTRKAATGRDESATREAPPEQGDGDYRG